MTSFVVVEDKQKWHFYYRCHAESSWMLPEAACSAGCSTEKCYLYI
jgi:hypothetical protein